MCNSFWEKRGSQPRVLRCAILFTQHHFLYSLNECYHLSSLFVFTSLKLVYIAFKSKNHTLYRLYSVCCHNLPTYTQIHAHCIYLYQSHCINLESNCDLKIQNWILAETHKDSHSSQRGPSISRKMSFPTFIIQIYFLDQASCVSKGPGTHKRDQIRGKSRDV